MPDPTLRQVMATVPTGVTIVAAREASGAPIGLTVNSFTSVSLEPPLVLVCIGHDSTSHDRLVAAGSFAVNILAADQAEIAMRFATSPSEGRFDDGRWGATPSGDPALEGAVGWLDCALDRVLTAGDHSILVGRVRSARTSGAAALVFHRGRMSATPE